MRKFHLLSAAKMRMTPALYINYNVCKMHNIGKRKAKWMYNMYIFKYSSNNKPVPVRWKLFLQDQGKINSPFLSLHKRRNPFFSVRGEACTPSCHRHSLCITPSFHLSTANLQLYTIRIYIKLTTKRRKFFKNLTFFVKI